MDEDIRGRFRRDFTNEQIGQPRNNAGRPDPVKIAEIGSTAPSQAQQPTVSQPEPIALSTKEEPSEPPVENINLNVPETHRAYKSPAKPKKRRVLLIFMIFILLAGAGSAAAYFSYKPKKQSQIPQSVKTQAKIPLLYPYTLPAGYTVAQSSFNVTGGNIIAYYANDSAGNRLNFTIQARPQNFDFNKFYTQIMSNATQFSTPLGQAAVGTANGHLLGSLITNTTWAIVTGNSNKVSADTLQAAISGLKYASY